MGFLRNIFRQARRANDFNVIVSDSDWTQEWIDIFSSQVVSVDVNFISKYVILNIRQLKSNHIQDLIFHLINDKGKMVDELRIMPIGTKNHEYAFQKGYLVSHHVSYDYDKITPVIHTLTLQFDVLKKFP